MQLFSGVNMHAHTYTHTSCCLLEREVRMTDTHTYRHLIACTNTHTSLRAPPLYTHTNSCLLESGGKMTCTNKQIHADPWLLAQTHIHVTRFSSTLTGAFSLYACSVTRHCVLISAVCDESSSSDGRSAYCTVKHPGQVLPFSSVTNSIARHVLL